MRAPLEYCAGGAVTAPGVDDALLARVTAFLSAVFAGEEVDEDALAGLDMDQVRSLLDRIKAAWECCPASERATTPIKDWGPEYVRRLVEHGWR